MLFFDVNRLYFYNYLIIMFKVYGCFSVDSRSKPSKCALLISMYSFFNKCQFTKSSFT